MGFIGTLFGGGDNKGMEFEAKGPGQVQLNDSWYNTQNSIHRQYDLYNQMAQQGGLANQSNVFAQQQALASQLGAQAAGGGPNPAQSQFQQNTNQIAAQTAGLIGAQKGMSPALQARLIAEQGANAGQGAAANAATLQAQQQLAAQNALMQQQAQMAGVAGQQVNQQQNTLNAYQQGSLQQQGNVLGLQGSANSANAGVQAQNAKGQGALAGGLMSGLGAVAGSVLGLSHGGEVPVRGPKSFVAQHFAGGGQVLNGESHAMQMKPVPGNAPVAGDSSKNDTVPAKLSPGEIIIPRTIALADNAPELAARFVAAVKAKHGRGIG